MVWSNDWAAAAACNGTDPDELFVQGAAQNRAKLICMGCQVRTECLADALDNRVEFGVWGGMTERERRALLRRRPAPGGCSNHYEPTVLTGQPTDRWGFDTRLTPLLNPQGRGSAAATQPAGARVRRRYSTRSCGSPTGEGHLPRGVPWRSWRTFHPAP